MGNQLQAISFTTQLGWVGMICRECQGSVRLVDLTFGHVNDDACRAEILKRDPRSKFDGSQPAELTDWQQLVQRYAAAEAVDLSEIPCDTDSITPFAQRVLLACCDIPYGQTRSYGELAKMSGSPRAARAVGAVMAANRVPLVVPCHRVVGASGQLRGFSAGNGLPMKDRLLQMEAQVAGLTLPAHKASAVLVG